MKAVLISIQPKWVEKIASGEKTIEVRKTKPKLEKPFKVYIYCTIGNGVKGDYLVPSGIQCGKVIGEFVCDRIDEYSNGELALSHNTDETCLTNCELADYIEGSKAYFWHISQLKIYDKPKELSEFKRVCGGNCQSCQYAIWQTSGLAYEPYIVDCKPITRPPQSWCYVED